MVMDACSARTTDGRLMGRAHAQESHRHHRKGPSPELSDRRGPTFLDFPR